MDKQNVSLWSGASCLYLPRCPALSAWATHSCGPDTIHHPPLQAGVIVTAVNEGDNRDFDAIVSCEVGALNSKPCDSADCVMPPASGSNSSIMLSSDKDAKFQIKLTPEQPQQEVCLSLALASCIFRMEAHANHSVQKTIGVAR
eukprot:scaffold238371_cov17-Tisochrysis_lutea.AAC.2